METISKSKITYLVASLFVTLFFLFNEVKAQTMDCPPPCQGIVGGDCQVVEVPGFPGCFVRVSYVWKRCGDDVWIQFRKLEFVVDTADCTTLTSLATPCDDLRDYLYPNNPTDWTVDRDAARDIADRVYLAIMKALFLVEYNGAMPWNKWEYECPNVKITFRAVYQQCARFIVTNGGSPTSPIPVMELIGCGEEGCCVKKTSICFNTLTSELEVTELWDVYDDESDCDIPLLPWEGPVLYDSGCGLWCDVDYED